LLLLATLALLFSGALSLQAADLTYEPYGTWNGKRIYLSPARHDDSGSRGECGSLDENTLGYYLAYYAANSSYYSDAYNPSSSYRNLRARGYKVRIGRGTLQSAIDNSNAWGATLHIPMHSNADKYNQCSRTDASRFGTVIIYWHTSGGGPDLAAKLRDRVGTYSGATSPGTNDFTCYNPGHPCTTITLGELRYTSAVAAYMESEFHTWNTGATWLSQAWQWGWRVGWAVDVHLGYPRRIAGGGAYEPWSPLAPYPGFGHQPERDEALFDREEMLREQRVATCMQEAGFSYWPEPSVLLDDDTDPAAALEQVDHHPNAQYVALLSPAGRQAYYLALYGIPDPFDPDAEALHDPASAEGGGCWAQALRGVPGVFAAQQALRDELDEMEQRLAADPRVRAAEARWSSCMAQRGYRAANPAELLASVDEQGASGLLAHPQAELSAAQAESASCAAESGLPGTVAAVRSELEGELVEAHRSLLEEPSSPPLAGPERRRFLLARSARKLLRYTDAVRVGTNLN
jgi:hypothetical protein